MRRLLSLTAMLALAIPLVVAGCGSSKKKTTSNTSAAPPAAKAATTTVGLGTAPKLGKILVDGKGRSLYLFLKDKTSKSTCSGACASAWPPLTTDTKAKAGAGVNAALLGTSKRADGSTEVTYNGHPLYYYAGDTAAGQLNGQGLKQFGAEWYVLGAKGSKVEAKGS